MTFDDQQLDDLLRAVQTPESLKDRLKEIPDQEGMDDGLVRLPARDELPQRRSRVGWYALAAVAAAVALLTVMSIWPVETAPNTTLVEQGSVPDTPLESDIANHSIELELLEIKLEAIESVMLEQEIKRLEKRLASLKQQAVPVGLPEREQQSIVLSLSCQAAMELGASIDSVRDDLLQVVEHYPGSQGAEFASRMLANENTKEEFHN